MKELQHSRVLQSIAPVAIKDNAAFVSLVNDCKDASYGEYHLNLGVTDIAMAVLKVMESDTITDTVTLGGTPTEVLDVTTKPSATDDGSMIVIGVNFKTPRKRYLQLQVTAGDGAAGTFASAEFILLRDGENDTDAAGRECGYVEYA